MANHKSALKRARQSIKRAERNTIIISAMKTALKKAITTIQESTTIDVAKQALIAGEKALRKAASKGAIPKTRASRKTSRLATLVNKKFNIGKAVTKAAN